MMLYTLQTKADRQDTTRTLELTSMIDDGGGNYEIIHSGKTAKLNLRRVTTLL